MMIISFLLWILAAVANSVQDTLAHHFDRSVFALIHNEALREWFRSDWIQKYKYFLGIYDGWHTFKALMLVSIVGAIITFPDFSKRIKNVPLAIFLILVWWIVFELFYSEILLVK